MNTKAYDIRLKRNDIFCLYLSGNDEATLITDEKNPYPCTLSKWHKETNSFSDASILIKGIGSNASIRAFSPDKIIFPTYAVQKEDFNDFLEIQVQECLKFEISQKYEGERSFYLLTKEWDDVIEVGMGFYKGHGTKIHEVSQSIIDRYLNLKAFW